MSVSRLFPNPLHRHHVAATTATEHNAVDLYYAAHTGNENVARQALFHGANPYEVHVVVAGASSYCVDSLGLRMKFWW